jgi:hypothetical protein
LTGTSVISTNSVAEEQISLTQWFHHEPVTDDDIHDTANELRRRHCVSRDCATLYGLDDAIHALEYYSIPNSLALGPPPANFKQVTLQALRKGVLVHPERFKAICDVLVRTPAGMRNHDNLIGLIAVEIAVSMDHRQGRCMPRLMTHFPPGAEIDNYIENTILPDCKSFKLGSCVDVHRHR